MDPEELLRRVFPPMLASLSSGIPRDQKNWIFELKYDGFRATTAIADGKAAMWSRNSLDLSGRFPQVFTAFQKLKVGEAVIDGEIAALDEHNAPRFQLLQRGENRTYFFAFDLLWLDGRDLRNLPVEKRRELLEQTIGRGSKLIQVTERIEGSAKAALQDAAKRGYEGLIAKRRESRYESRRSKEWLKIKAINAQELAIVGFTDATNSDREIGSLILGVVDNGKFRYAGRVGTGFSTRQRVDLRRELMKDKIAKPAIVNAPRMKGATWVDPRFVAQVRFTEWTSDGSLRHPSFLGLRPDKSPMECVVERPAARPTEGERGREGEGEQKKKGKKKSTLKSARPRPVAPSPPRTEIKLTNPDRMLYPRGKITKQDVANYYDAMAEPIINTLAGRPLSLEHWNQGIDRPSWFHQNITREAQDWMTLVETPTRTRGRSVRHLVVDNRETLRWLAQNSVLTMHMWSSRAESLENPDWVVFDLDPAKGKGIEQAIEAAMVLRKLLDNMKVPSVPKTSGKRGIHVFIPLIPGYSHEDAAEWACTIAEAIAKTVPFATVERSLSERRGRLYFDCLQNGYGKTVVAPYALRGIEGAPVSAPLLWSEVNKKLDPSKFNIRTMPERYAKHGDLFQAAVQGGVQLPRLR